MDIVLYFFICSRRMIRGKDIFAFSFIGSILKEVR